MKTQSFLITMPAYKRYLAPRKLASLLFHHAYGTDRAVFDTKSCPSGRVMVQDFLFIGEGHVFVEVMCSTEAVGTLLFIDVPVTPASGYG